MYSRLSCMFLAFELLTFYFLCSTVCAIENVIGIVYCTAHVSGVTSPLLFLQIKFIHHCCS